MTDKDKCNVGHVTLPVDAGQEKLVLQLIEKWGADAIRDCEGACLTEDLIRQAGLEVYSTICLARADQEYPRRHPESLAQKFLMSHPVTAERDSVEIEIMASYYKPKYQPNTNGDPHQYWQVFDRTTGEPVNSKHWEYDEGCGVVRIENAVAFHVYTVNFLAYQTWDTTSMYNHMVNGWERPPVIGVDPFHADTKKHLFEYFDCWLSEKRLTNVVRLTSLAYHFTVDSDAKGEDKFRDWCGYQETVSAESLKAFARKYGYELTAEDFVDQGYYNSICRVPSRKYLDWMEHVQDFVIDYGKELVGRVHRSGKRAAIFWGDHWIGAEFYSPKFQQMDFDIVVGACEDGVALRRLSDIPGEHVREARFYPYFHPDVFCEGGDPLAESISNWTKIRRAMLRKPIDRIGYGGYLRLTEKFPAFLDHAETICNEFREIRANSNGQAAINAPLRVGVLTAWGKLRSWMYHAGADEKFKSARADVVTIVGSNLLECLSGLPVEVEFLTLEDVARDGVDSEFDVIINDGAAGTAWSGGEYWTNPDLTASLRRWVHSGGGFLGVRDPSAVEYQGAFFQLADVLGVQKEVGRTFAVAACCLKRSVQHFIVDDKVDKKSLNVEHSCIYPCTGDVDVLWETEGGHVLLSSHEYGGGRGVYLADMPFDWPNARLLYRILLWLGKKEDWTKRWFSQNLNLEVAAYDGEEKFAVINNSPTAQSSVIYDGQGQSREVTLEPYELQWLDI